MEAEPETQEVQEREVRAPYQGTAEFGQALADRPVSEGGGQALDGVTIRAYCQQGRIPGAVRDHSRPAHPWLIPADAVIQRPPGGLAYRHGVKNPVNDDGISPKVAAKRLDVHRVTIYDWLRRGLVPGAHRREDGSWYIPDSIDYPPNSNHYKKNRVSTEIIDETL